MRRLPKICVILGAGASHDVRSSGSPINWQSGLPPADLGLGYTNNDYQPPIAMSLFDMQAHEPYHLVLDHYPGAVVVANDISPAVKAGIVSLEEALAGIAYHDDRQMRQHYKHVPPYVRDLIAQCVRHYTPYPSNYIRLVTELLAHQPHEVCFLVLNYDDLLEKALYRHTAGGYSFENIQDYVEPGRTCRVIKLHGSINWFRRLGPGSSGRRDNWFDLVEGFDPLTPPEDEAEYRIYPDMERVSSHSDLLYPVLTAPLEEKDALRFTCPLTHETVAREFLRDCTKYLIIGSSGFDKDLLKLLRDEIPRHQRIRIHFVGSRDAENAFGKFIEAVPQLVGSRNKPGEDVFHDGFSTYASSPAFKYFGSIGA